MNKILLLGVLILNGSMLLSCQQKPGQAVSDSAELRGSVSPSTPAKQAKPGAQVSLVSDNTVILTADKVTTVDILLSAQVGDGTLQVELNPGEGLQLRGAAQVYDFVRSENGQYPIKADLYAAANGRYYLNVNASIRAGDTSAFRSLAVIVQVGAPAAGESSVSDRLKKASDENIISLPAQEQIINQ